MLIRKKKQLFNYHIGKKKGTSIFVVIFFSEKIKIFSEKKVVTAIYW